MPVRTEQSEGVHLSNMAPGSMIEVQTKNHRYRIECLGGEKIRISGHPLMCPTPTESHFLGSRFRGGLVEEDYVGVGMHLMFQKCEECLPITTSQITGVTVTRPQRERVA